MQSLPWNWVDLAQMLLAVGLGFIVGIEREVNHKPAGMKTIMTVTLCSTLLMQLSFKLPLQGTGAELGDPARLAAAVMTGIGFLGAGVIIQRGHHIEGITTAATVWIMAGVGLAVGAGYYVPAMFAVSIIMLGFLLDPYKDRLAEYIRRHMPGAVDADIPDETHQQY